MNVTIWAPPDLRVNTLKGPFFRALSDSASRAGIRCRTVPALTVPNDVVIAWGYGHWWQSPAIKQSGRFVMFDLGYFGRQPDKLDMPLRVSFDKMHSPELVFARDWSPDRWDALGIALRNDFDPDGPVILVGQGGKSCKMYGEKPGEWERRRLAEIRMTYPQRNVLFRPKPGRGHLVNLDKLRLAEGSIAEALRGASLVVCRHSNVALDAMIAGIPVACDDGLASAVCGRTLPADPSPVSDYSRLRVLHCAANLQWWRREAASGAVWRFLKEMIG